MNATATEVQVDEPLDNEQRCDRCNAQAVVVIFLPTEGGEALDLLFCAHHWREHRAAVLDKAPSAVVHLHKAHND